MGGGRNSLHYRKVAELCVDRKLVGRMGRRLGLRAGGVGQSPPSRRTVPRENRPVGSLGYFDTHPGRGRLVGPAGLRRLRPRPRMGRRRKGQLPGRHRYVPRRHIPATRQTGPGGGQRELGAPGPRTHPRTARASQGQGRGLCAIGRGAATPHGPVPTGRNGRSRHRRPP